MAIGRYREQALENLALSVIKGYDTTLLSCDPRAIPIEDIIEQHYGLKVEYQVLSKKGSILGLTVFEDAAVPVYDKSNTQYVAIFVNGGTILIDSRLCTPSKIGRLRFTFAHELAHFLIHKEYYMNHGITATKNSKESDNVTEREADVLSAALLMPLGRVKVAFNRLRGACSSAEAVSCLSKTFEVSCQAMEIRLKYANLI